MRLRAPQFLVSFGGITKLVLQKSGDSGAPIHPRSYTPLLKHAYVKLYELWRDSEKKEVKDVF
jgi:hypothetical protein